MTASAASEITIPGRLGLLSSRVVPGVGAAGRTVVGAVGRFIAASVRCGRTLVSISLDTGPEPNFAVPASPANDPDSPINAVPSVRQKVRVLSLSTRLHWGQRFIFFFVSTYRRRQPPPSPIFKRISYRPSCASAAKAMQKNLAILLRKAV